MVAATDHTARGTGAALRVRLRVDRFDELTHALGAETETAKADLMEIDRKSLWRYKHAAGGVTPSAELAMRWAQKLGTTVEDLWERVA